MAERRMFAKAIVLSDAFLDMPMSARCLYFTLGMLADDDGFVGNPKSIMRQCGASEDDMRILVSKKYVLGFDSGVIVIKHWRMNNYLRNDRHNPTTYLEELNLLGIDDKGAYTTNAEKSERLPCGIPVDNQAVYQSVTQDSIGKNSIDKYKDNTYSRAGSTSEEVKEIIDYLNQAAGTKYKYGTRKTKDCIKARMNEGFTVEDFKIVINKKVKEWKGTKQEIYIRPETLFGNKFEGYLNQQITNEASSGGNDFWAEFDRIRSEDNDES